MIAEVIVLVWALVVAMMRLLPGPACRPVRFLATVYVDVFRGVPALLVIYIVGLGLRPGQRADRSATSPTSSTRSSPSA